MYIERLQVEEGFLDGLDIKFKPGLNSIIGARGTGKTSLIELIRFCLDAGGNLQETSRKSREHALSILGSGQVIVTLAIDGQQVIVSRTASDSSPQSTGFFQKPIIFSQTEIETIGLEPTGRLRLIDGFVQFQKTENAEEKQVVASIASLSAEAKRVRDEIEELEGRLRESSLLNEELKNIATLEAKVASSSEELHKKTEHLKNLSEKISSESVQESTLTRAQGEVFNWYQKIKESLDYNPIEDSDSSVSLLQFSSSFLDARTKIKSAQDIVANVWHTLEQTKKDVIAVRLNDEAQARASRQDVETIQAGAGQVMRRAQELREKRAKLDAMDKLYAAKTQALEQIVSKRGTALDRLEQLRQSRFEARQSIIQNLNATLSPSIKIEIIRNGQQSGFTASISDMLRGSGVKYGEIAPALASTVSPRVLLEAVDRFDSQLISDATGISLERAAKVLVHLRNCDVGNIGTIDLEDEILMQLLDGTDYKDINALSTGQRCTVILPLILAHKDKVVIVDQPEDHIDNAFIANTLIRAILNRSANGQIIFTTHNPNIPVLGNADNVVQMESDGKRGYVSAKGALNDCEVIEAISTVMEGGAEAFTKRSYFYSQHPSFPS